MEHVIALPEEAIPSLGIQDAALCQVWMSNGGGRVNPPAGLDSLPGRLQRWLAAAATPALDSAGRRNQTLLRELINRLEDDRVDEMERDELDLLETVFGFAHAVQNSGAFERVRHAIAPRRARIAVRRAGQGPVVAAPALSARLLVVSPRDLIAAQPREIKRFAGVDLPSRGPVMVHRGHVRVLGDVPEGTTVVVEEGACVVDGVVLGRIAVSGDCEVMQNISGVVISRHGDVRARYLVDGAFVVAKRGRVMCRRSHGAKLVFAGDQIRVEERSVRSRFLAPVVRVGVCIEGGEIHASQRIEAGDFRSPSDATLEVVFRRSLSCKDYGEDPGKVMTTDVSRALRCRADWLSAREQLQLTIQEAEDAAETALTFILAGDAAAELAAEVIAAQRRLDVINRVLVGLRALYAEAEVSIEGGDNASVREGGTSNERLLQRLDDEIVQIVVDSAGDAGLKAPYDELVDSRKRVKAMRGGLQASHVALTDIGQKLHRWRQEFIDLKETVHAGRERIRASLQTQELLDEGRAGRSRVLALQRLTQKVAGADPSDRLRRRIESPIVMLKARTVEKLLTHAKKCKEEATRAQELFEQAREIVSRQYQMKIDAGDLESQRIVIEGRFATSVRLWADAVYFGLPAGEVPTGGSRTVPSSGKGPARYVCTGSVITEERTAAPNEAVMAAI